LRLDWSSSVVKAAQRQIASETVRRFGTR
jgi:hypothetical protein